jgi:Protein of unknown function (DUF3047)
MPGNLPKPCWTDTSFWFGLLAGLLLTQTAFSQAPPITAFSKSNVDLPPAPWKVQPFPGSAKPVSQFEVTSLDGQRVLRVIADKSYGTLQHDLAPATVGQGSKLRWRWRLDQPLRDADLRQKKGDDSPLKVCALFDMPLKQLGFFDRNFLLAARAMSKQTIPAATLCYVWDHKLPVGTELSNAFTRRVRYVVVNSGDSQLKSWLMQERDLVNDFRRAFGEETDTIPPLIGLAIGADADNTGGVSLGYVGDVELTLIAPGAP